MTDVRSDRDAAGRAARKAVPRTSHAGWSPPADRAAPITWLEEQAAERVAELVPIRYARMRVSPFTYFRGAALAMAADLATTPASGFEVQLCGDAHLANFGVFGSPERHLVFDVNDFDETHPGPWEWDVKRLAASFAIAARDDGFDDAVRAHIVHRAVGSYRRAMRSFAAMPALQVWYAHLDVAELLPRFEAQLDPKATPAVWRAIEKARAHDSTRAYGKLTYLVDGEPSIRSDPPLTIAIEELTDRAGAVQIQEVLTAILMDYRTTLQGDRQHLFDRFRLVHAARRVVGVGSVGTRTWIALFLDRAHGEPLFLQVKEAQHSVLERFTKPTVFENHGERVVAGQRLMQASSDIFLGWHRSPRLEGGMTDHYVRQLADWKGSADIAGMTPSGMSLYAEMCGWTLARAHARSGDPVAIGGYLGGTDTFDRAVGAFAEAYADQNELDHAAFVSALESGRLPTESS